MIFRRPIETLRSIFETVIEIVTHLNGFPDFEIRKISFNATASTVRTFELKSLSLSRIDGALQIGSTFTDAPLITYKNTTSMNVRYNFSADTDGQQTATYLLIGK